MTSNLRATFPPPATETGATAAQSGEALDRSGGVPVLRWPSLERAGALAVGTTRLGGLSSGPYESLNLGFHVGDDAELVLENRRRALATLGATLDQLVLPRQVHGSGVAVVSAGDAGRGAREAATAVEGADALVTDDPEVVLAVLVADCAPVVLVDPDARVLACAHAGWRGAAGGVLERTVEAMASCGARPGRTTAVIGPSVAPEDYEVDEPVARAFRRHLGDLLAEPTALLHPARSGRDDRWQLDLAGACDRALVRAGLDQAQVYRSATRTSDSLLFSHRRAASRPCGRFGVLARLVV